MNISTTSFLITGGAGFIGSHLSEYLLKNGAKKVRVLDNFSTGALKNVEHLKTYPNFELIDGDIRKLDDCKKAVEGIDCVSHQAALGSVPRSVKDPLATHAHNVDGFLNMLNAAKEAGVRRFVYASSSSVYGDSPELPKQEGKEGNLLSPYAVSKYTNELYASVFHRCYGMEVIGLRYFNIFGPRQSPDGPYAAVIPLFINNILHSKEVVINGDGEHSRDFTYVQNAVQANVKAMSSKDSAAFGKAFNIACGQRITLNQLYTVIAQELKSAQKSVHGPERQGDIRHSLADISLARALLGYDPQVLMEEGLKETVAWFLSGNTA